MHTPASRPLVVDRRIHRGEIARFARLIVRGPQESDCAIWIGAIGDDGYGRFWLGRPGGPTVVRPNRYALALAHGELGPEVLALHECDNPICALVHPKHVVEGTHTENMNRMARAGRGGGNYPRGLRPGLDRRGRAARSRALRDAVRDGWNEQAVSAAKLGSTEPTLF